MPPACGPRRVKWCPCPGSLCKYEVIVIGLLRERPDSVLFWIELQRDGVDAVAQSCRRRPVREDMAEMGVAGRAQDFRPDHAEAAIRVLGDIGRDGGGGEAGPAAAGVEFRVGLE